MSLSWLLSLLYPPKCVFCGQLLPKEQTDVCSACRRTLPYCASPVRRVPYSRATTAVFDYEGLVRESILRFKFRGRSQYCAAYGRLLAMKITQQELKFDLICFVPVSRKRRWTRGYDQAQLLAQAVGRELGCETKRLLRKIRHNPAQSSLHAPERRRANVLGVYRPASQGRLTDKRVLIIDDVMTTGATLSECCRVLLDAGAAQVSCAVLAAAHRDKGQQVIT